MAAFCAGLMLGRPRGAGGIQDRFSFKNSTDVRTDDARRRAAVRRGLRGNLLMVHGTGDDNVHYQGTEALINRLVERNKPFTMTAYPNRSHGIHERSGTTRHLFELLTRYLHENLAPGAEDR